MGIRELIDEINAEEGWVTTSSCAGRVSIFLEGSRENPSALPSFGDALPEEESRETTAKVGGKGGGGRWLFVSHDRVSLGKGLIEKMEMLKRDGRERGGEKRFIHFKFEPMVPFPSNIYFNIYFPLFQNTHKD